MCVLYAAFARAVNGRSTSGLRTLMPRTLRNFGRQTRKTFLLRAVKFRLSFFLHEDARRISVKNKPTHYAMYLIVQLTYGPFCVPELVSGNGRARALWAPHLFSSSSS